MGQQRTEGRGGGRNHPLSAMDAAFLAVEDRGLPMHVGAVLVFDQVPAGTGGGTGANDGGAAGEGPGGDVGLSLPRLRRLLRSRLHLVPRYRQRVATVPLGLAPPWWVDDPGFDIDHHLQRHRLSEPGDERQLLALAAQLLTRPLDRERPLWELHLVEGLEDDRVALVGKLHHAVVDGVAGLGTAGRLLATDPEPGRVPAPRPFEPEPAPGTARRVSAAACEQLTRPGRLLARARGVAGDPVESTHRLLRAGLGAASLAGTQLEGPVRSGPLNHRARPARQLAGTRLDLEVVREVSETFGATVNDVVLAVVAAATGRWLRARGEDTHGLWMRVLVPVSVRSQDEDGALGNRVTGMFVRLPMFSVAPLERLRICQQAMAVAKRTGQADGAQALLDTAELVPPPLRALGARATAHARLFNFVITNVPGPGGPLHCLGARLRAVYPFVPLGPFQPFAVGVTSAGGVLSAGVTTDGSFRDLEELPDLLTEAVRELGREAEATPAPVSLADWRRGRSEASAAARGG